MTPADKFKSLYPQAVFLDFSTQDWVKILYQNSWVSPSDNIISIEKAGEGNMNFVVRVKTTSKSIILKQSRPWVEKYPQVAAPVERVTVEAGFYEAVSNDDFYKRFCPRIIGFDPTHFLLAIEDLGHGADCTTIYNRNNPMPDEEVSVLFEFISHLHNTPLPNRERFPDNSPLKKLNHTHIFLFPYLEENGFNLDTVQEGLQRESMKYKTNEVLKDNLTDLGKVYLQTGDILLHGDYYPGSWLRTPSGIKIIDPEFSHYGRAEFDIGVMAAHLLMGHVKIAQLTELMRRYRMPAEFNRSLFSRFCGVEILRRIIGLAQLPLDLSLSEKSDLMRRAEQMILHPETETII
jgi:5-methylthioribose kinase